MFKRTHVKTITAFLVIGLIIITGLGMLNILNLEDIKDQTIDSNINFEQKISDVRKLTVALDIGYAILCLIMAIVVSMFLNRPIVKLISDAEKMVSNENKSQRNNKKSDEVVNAFNMMTDELRESLNEMTRQKKQIETIIVHMTDAIIAFNMQGEVILVNPAANRLLRLLPQDKDFKTIFNRKINLDINMEKIIYLENWTSTEQKITVGDKV